MKNLLLLAAVCFWAAAVFAQTPRPSVGTLRHFENFPSKLVAPRAVDVWLPANYDAKRRYAVLYMHDGQMLFDSAATWNHQEWCVDETLARLLADGRVRDCIVVGIWNTGAHRHAEYAPQRVFESLTPAERELARNSNENLRQNPLFTEGARSDAYLKFLVTELKPFVDSAFSTRLERASTFVAGSSMGGLISLYAICEYPQIFGGAACLSTHWPGIFRENDNPIPAAIFRYLRAHLPSPAEHRLYFDLGTATLDALYPASQREVDAILREKGYSEKNWTTRTFEGADHSERAWRERLEIPLSFLLGK